jgi:integrase
MEGIKMTGSIYFRGRARGWAYQIFLGRDTSGKQRRVVASGFRTKKEAAAALRERIRELEEQTALTTGEPRTLRQVVLNFITQAERRLGRKTVERYRQMLPYFHAGLMETPVSEITTLMLEREYWRLRESGGRRRKTGDARPLSAKTVRGMAGLISAALNDAVRLGLIRSSPASAVKLPPTENKERRSLSPEELERYFAAAAGHWIEPILRLAAATGMRRGELLTLLWSDVDFAAGTITVSKSLEQTKAGLRVKETKTRTTRVIRIGPSAVEALRLQHALQDSWRRELGSDYRDQGLVFSAPDGGFLKPDTTTAEACRVAAKAGLKGVGLHTLRHTHGSMLLSAGVPLPTVSKRLGHANPNITAAVYAHALPSDEERAAEAFERVIRKVAEPRPERIQ